MRNTDHLTREQLRASMNKPLSPSAVKRLRKAMEEDGWLLAHNLREMSEDGQIIVAKTDHDSDKGLLR